MMSISFGRGSSAFALRLGLRLLYCCALAGPGAWQAHGGVTHLYVEPFATKSGAEKLREDATAEIRKLNSISIVPEASNADLILGGGGEIWIKGYRSLNPRSGRLPSDGTPLYAGFLSVELKNRSGLTLWSDLVTPGSESGDVSRDLAKRIAKHLAEAIGQVEALSAPKPLPAPATILNGAGATFPYPIYSKWFANYRRGSPGTGINYEPIGSEAGVRKLLAGGADFGASDSPEVLKELSPAAESGYLLLPTVVGAVVPIVNLPGFPNEIAFTPEALAGIFLGKITKWNDPVLARSNHGLNLPDRDIVVVHRADGSGTSYAWSSYLSRYSREWSAEAGVSLAPRWPAGRAASGNDGVAKLVKELGGSIGYVEFIYALQNHLSYGKVRNRNGEFVSAGLEGIASAVNAAMGNRGDLTASIVDASGPGAYPITSFTWLVVPLHIADDAKRGALSSFLQWMLASGQRQAAALGYLALPKDVIAKEEDAIARIH